MKRTLAAIFGVALLAGATTVFAQTVFVNCGSPRVTAGGRLNTAAGSAARTLVVNGTCTENMTVRNLRVTIDLTNGSIVALNTGSPAITFTGGTTDATITGGTVSNAGTGGGIVVDRNASVTIQNVFVDAFGGGDAVGIRRGGLATLNTNTISGAGSGTGRGIRIRDQAFMSLGTGGSLNTIENVQRGITCREGSVVAGVSGNTGLANFVNVTTTNDGVPTSAATTVTAGGATSCFNDQ